MKKCFRNLLLGLFVIVSGIAVTVPANAFTLHNYTTNYCLTDLGYTKICDNSDYHQIWYYNTLDTPLPPPPSNGSFLGFNIVKRNFPGIDVVEYLAATDLELHNGTPVLFYFDNSSNSYAEWELWWAIRDAGNHDCYVIENREDHGASPPMVLSVLGGVKNEPNGGHINGGQIVVYQQFFTPIGAPDTKGHPDQYWCVY